MSTPSRRLAIVADDFGMCRAVNRGVLETMRAGVVTQASVMVVTPHSDEALAFARDGLPCAVHLVAASDWDLTRWPPLTDSPTLVDEDGCFPAHPSQLVHRADPMELAAEWFAQIARVCESGCAPLHADVHIALAHPHVLADVCRLSGLATREALPDAPDVALAIDSLFHLSSLAPENKVSALHHHLVTLPPGDHVIVAHPAVDDPELERLCSDRWPGRRAWATSIRTSDLRCLLAPAIRRALWSSDIELTTTNLFARRADTACVASASAP